MTPETKEKIKKTAKGTWGAIKFFGGIALALCGIDLSDEPDAEEKEKLKRQEEMERDRLERQRREEEEERLRQQRIQREREEVAAKYAAMSKQDMLAAVLKDHDEMRELRAEVSRLNSEVSDLEDDNSRLSRENRFVKRVANQKQDVIDSVASSLREMSED